MPYGCTTTVAKKQFCNKKHHAKRWKYLYVTLRGPNNNTILYAGRDIHDCGQPPFYLITVDSPSTSCHMVWVTSDNSSGWSAWEAPSGRCIAEKWMLLLLFIATILQAVVAVSTSISSHRHGYITQQPQHSVIFSVGLPQTHCYTAWVMSLWVAVHERSLQGDVLLWNDYHWP